MANTRSGSGVSARADANGKHVGMAFGWPQERWVGVIILISLGLLILIRRGFRGIGVSASAAGRVSV